MKKIMSIISIVLLLLAGLALLFYPDISNWLAKRSHSTAIQEYSEGLFEMTAGQMEAEKQKAKEYNDALSGAAIKDPFIPESGMALPENYATVLNLNGTIGYIEIPEINVSLPIYHGTGEVILKRGAGHMEMTAFPIGGEGNHTVLTGHTGLPSARLFTDLDQLVIGDVFYIHVLDETLAYEVDQILVVQPENTEDLRPVKGKDYVTLITCTPYGINSHRLLIRGTRISYTADEMEQAEKIVKNPINWRVLIIVSSVTMSVAGFGICKLVNRRKKRGG